MKDLAVYLQLALMFLIPLIAVMVAIQLGQWYGKRRNQKAAAPDPGSVGSVVTAVFGLLAFMLAFTFQIVTNRYDTRRSLLLEETTNIRTTYLRAGLLPEPYRSGARAQLMDYVSLRVDLSKDLSKLNRVLFRSQQILDTCWAYAERLAVEDRSSEAYALYTSSVNDLVDDFNQRVAVTLSYRIPVPVISILGIITFLSMLMLGYQFGISGKGSFRVQLLLATVFSVVILLVLALDRPDKGFLKLNQSPVIKLHEQLEKMQSARSK